MMRLVSMWLLPVLFGVVSPGTIVDFKWWAWAIALTLALVARDWEMRRARS